MNDAYYRVEKWGPGAGALFGDLVFAYETTPPLAHRAKGGSKGDGHHGGLMRTVA